MRPETRVFVQALRAGKSGDEAFIEYCWAKMLIPINGHDYREARKAGEDGLLTPMERRIKAVEHAIDAFDADCSDNDIGAVFEASLAIDTAWGTIWRPMRKSERPTQGQLVRAMDDDARAKAAEILGPPAVAKMLVSR